MIEQVYARLRDKFKKAEMGKLNLNLNNGGRSDGNSDKKS